MSQSSPQAEVIPFGDIIKEHDWEIIDKTVFKSVYQQVNEAGVAYEDYYSMDNIDYIQKIVFVFKCNVTGEYRIEERTSEV